MPIKHLKAARNKVHSDLSKHPLLVHSVNLSFVPYYVIAITLSLMLGLLVTKYAAFQGYKAAETYYLSVYDVNSKQNTINEPTKTNEPSDDLDVLFQDVLEEDSLLNDLEGLDEDTTTLEQEAQDVLGVFDDNTNSLEDNAEDYTDSYNPKEDIYYFPESE